MPKLVLHECIAESGALTERFRAGWHTLDTYSYKTWENNLNKTVNEIDRVFTSVENRMTTKANLFVAPKDYPNQYFVRSSGEHNIFEVDSPQQTNETEVKMNEVSLSFRVYNKSGFKQSESQSWLDNAVFDLSSILWEFNPTKGNGRWYPLYDLPNRAYTRITLPRPTTTMRIRALSNNPDEWIQNFAIMPVPDYQTQYVDAVDELNWDEPSYTTANNQDAENNYAVNFVWNEPEDGHGIYKYEVYVDDSEEPVVIRGLSFFDEFASESEPTSRQYIFVAYDETGKHKGFTIKPWGSSPDSEVILL